MAALWFEEQEKAVWHLAVETARERRYRMACGWELELRDARRLWPAKSGEVGPQLENRCHACLEAEPERGLR